MEKKKIFNQSVLDKMSTPEQLDKQIVITSRSSWAFLLGGFLIVIATLIWSFTGWLLVTKSATGLIISNSNSQPITTTVTGIVKDVYVDKGDVVQEGDKLFAYESDVYDDAIKDIEERKSIVQAVTLNSKHDVVNSDTSDLVALKLQKSAAESDGNSAEITLSEYQSELKKINNQIATAKETVEKTKKHYEKACSDYSAGLITEAELNAIKDKYSKAESEYSALVSQKNTLSQQIKQAEIQQKIVKADNKEQGKNLSKQFQATKEGILNAIDDEMKQYEKSKDSCIVTSNITGTVTELHVAAGTATAQGYETMTIRNLSDSDAVVQCYISAQEGMGIKEGMEVAVYPTFLDSQEYGHMEATVVSVDDYYASGSDIKSALGNAQLAESVLQMGPTIAFACKLRTDDTVSGYYWSSKNGRNVEISDATLVNADVVIEKNHPISSLVPYLKNKAYGFVSPKPEK